MDRLLRWIAWRLPRRLVMWCAYRVGAHATTGEFGWQIVTELRFMDAMGRWNDPKQTTALAEAQAQDAKP